MTQIDARLTPTTPEAVAGAMVWAYRQVVGMAPPSDSSWRLPLAQSALETANWSQLFNYNAGNVTTAHPDTDDWYYNPHVTVDLKFHAFPTLGQGCITMMSWLKNHGAIPSADAGDAEAYRQALIAGGYAGADYPSLDGFVAKYAVTIPKLYWEIPNFGVIGTSLAIVSASYLGAKYLAAPRQKRRQLRWLTA
jgi:hypothetical protein